MSLFQYIVIFVICGLSSVVLYGIWTIENDRDEFHRKHGYDPYRHGWKEEDDKNQDQ